MRKLVGVLAALMIGLTATLAVASPAQAATITFTKVNQWSTGYTGQVTVTNNFAVPVSGWEVDFLLPAGSTVSNAWLTQIAQTTPYYAMINVAWNGNLAPGASVTFGFIVAGTGDPTFLWPPLS